MAQLYEGRQVAFSSDIAGVILRGIFDDWCKTIGRLSDFRENIYHSAVNIARRGGGPSFWCKTRRVLREP